MNNRCLQNQLRTPNLPALVIPAISLRIVEAEQIDFAWWRGAYPRHGREGRLTSDDLGGRDGDAAAWPVANHRVHSRSPSIQNHHAWSVNRGGTRSNSERHGPRRRGDHAATYIRICSTTSPERRRIARGNILRYLSLLPVAMHDRTCGDRAYLECGHLGRA